MSDVEDGYTLRITPDSLTGLIVPSMPDAITAGISPSTGFRSEAAGPPICSPTQTVVWQACRRKWQLDRSGYELRIAPAAWSPAKVVGSAVHAGFAALNRGGTSLDAEATVCAVLKADWVEQDRYLFQPTLEKSINAARRAHESIDLSIETVLAAEEEMGGCIPDLITRMGETLVDTQLKTSWYWLPEWWEKRTREYEVSWQQLHESWAAFERFRIPVTLGRVIHVGMTPQIRVTVHDWSVDPGMVGQWASAWAYPTWYAIDRDRELRELSHELALPGNPLHCLDYGGCPYQKICWTYHGDLDKAGGYYDKVDPR